MKTTGQPTRPLCSLWHCLAALALLLAATPTAAAVKTSNAGARNWGTNGSWTPAGVPGGGDDVIIPNGSTVTLNANATVNSLTINLGGTLLIGNNATARTLSVNGNASNAGTLRYNTSAAHTVSVGGTLTNSGTLTVLAGTTGAKTLSVTGLITNSGIFRYAGSAALTVNAAGGISNSATFDVDAASNVTHILNVGGDITNTGTLNLAPDAASLCNTTFNRNGNQTVSGNGATTLFNVINLSMGATQANILDITASNFSIAATGYLNITSGTFRLSAPVTLSPFENTPKSAAPVDLNIPATGGFWVNNPGATVNTGNYNFSLTGGLLRMTAGTFNMGTMADNLLRPDTGSTVLIEGGTVNIAGRYTCINLPSGPGSTFIMTGGTLDLNSIGSTSGTYAPFCIDAATTFTMSGGTIIVSRPATGAPALGYYNLSATFNVTGGTLQIGDAGTPAGATIPVTSSVPVWNLVVNPTGGPTAQLVTNNLTVRNDVTIGAGATLNANNLDLSVGDGNAGGNWTNNGSFTAGTGTVILTGGFAGQAIGGASATTFNNLTLNKSANDLTVNTSPRVNGVLNLSGGKIITGANKVTIGPAGSITGAAANRYVVGNLEKVFSAAGAFTFQIGDPANWTPVAVNLTSLTTAGNLTVSTPTAPGDHPDTTAGTSSIDGTKSINRYWTFSGLTAGGTADVTFNYVNGIPVDRDAAATPASFVVARGTTCSGSGVLRTCGSWTRPTLSGVPTSTQASVTGVTLSTGAPDSDFAVGEPATGRFARESEFIYTRELY
jgi:G8 domain-containing protein